MKKSLEAGPLAPTFDRFRFHMLPLATGPGTNENAMNNVSKHCRAVKLEPGTESEDNGLLWG